MRLVFASRSDIGLRRVRNEDTVLVRTSLPDPKDWLLAAIADGMGGAAAGDVASHEAIRAFEAAMVSGSSDPHTALLDGFRAANAAVRARAASSPDLAGAGTTLVAAIIRADFAWIANVGDSRAYRFSEGSSEQITSDHTLVEDEVRAATLSEHQAATSRYRNVLTRNLGGTDDIAIDLFGPVSLASGDAIVLSSDGLHDYVPSDDIGRTVLALPPEQACEQLVALANDRGGPDNISVVVARLIDEERSPSPDEDVPSEDQER